MSSDAELIISLAKAALNACKSARECPQEAVRIGKRLQYLIARSQAWRVVLSNDVELSRRVYDALNDIFLCVQAASTNQQNWSRKVKVFLTGNTLLEELRRTEHNFEGVMRELHLEINTVVMEKMELGFASISEVLAKFASETKVIDGRGQTIQDQIDQVLAECHREKKLANKSLVDMTQTSAPSSRTPSALNFDDKVLEIEISDLKYDPKNEEDRLGRGGFGTVYRGLYQEDKPVAIKVFDLDFDSIKRMSDQQLQHEIDQVLAEVSLMKECSINPNVVDVYGCYFKDIRNEKNPLIVMERLDISLYDIIHHRSFCGEILSYTQRLHLMVGIANAVEFLHIRGIIHHDIKNRNILVNKERTVAKLSDFGEAKNKELKTTRQVITNNLNYQQVAGTVPYQAPEILLGVVRQSSRVSEMYSFGVTIWECWTGSIPHKGKREADITLLAVNGKSEPMLPIPSEPSEGELSEDETRAWEILQMTAKQCLSRERKERPNASLTLKMLEGCIRKADIPIHIKQQQQRKTFVEKHPYKILLVCIALIIVIVIAVFVFVNSTPTHTPTPTMYPIIREPMFPIMREPSPMELGSTPVASSITAEPAPKLTLTPTTLAPTPSPTLTLTTKTTLSPATRAPTTLIPARTPSPTLNNNNSCFETRDELYVAVRAYDEGMVQAYTKYGILIDTWCVGNIKGFSYLFENMDTFNEPIGSWNMSGAIILSGMFYNASSFNQDLSTWDTSSVTVMSGLFNDASAFDQDLSTWDTSSVADMSSMFQGASTFNQNISTWDVSSVTDMSSMFSGASTFNQNISAWDVSSVTDMEGMFDGAFNFNQNLCAWGERLNASLVIVDDELYSQKEIYIPIFYGTSCPTEDNPDLTTKSPLCYVCL